MESDRFSDISKLSLIELKHCQTGELPNVEFKDNELYKAQVHDFDARKAEALTLSEESNPLLALRALLFRGRLIDAEKILIEMAQKEKVLDPTELAELYLERARLAAFHGDWAGCQILSSRALALKPSPVTTLTLLQTRALADFELGRLLSARQDIKKAESLASVFPRSISAFYAAMLDVRIIARDLGTQSAQAELNSAWKIYSKDLHKDHLQVLLRTEIDLRRFGLMPHFRFALASYLVSKLIGEELYSSLALLDCFLSLTGPAQKYFEKSLAPARLQFLRVGRIFDEIEGLAPLTTSSGSMRDWKRHAENSKLDCEMSEEQIGAALKAKTLVFPELNLVVNLNPWTVLSLEGNPQIIKASLALAPGLVRKTEFFKSIWGNQKYSPEKHDNLIFTTLHRLRHGFGVNATVQQDWICLQNTFVVV